MVRAPNKAIKRFLVIQERPNPSTDYFVLPYLRDLGGVEADGLPFGVNEDGFDVVENPDTPISLKLDIPTYCISWAESVRGDQIGMSVTSGLGNVPLDDIEPALDGAFVVFVRYVTQPWRKLIEQHRSKLAGLAYFFDDDIPDIKAGAGLPLKYRFKLYRYGARHFKWLLTQNASFWVSTPYLQNKYQLKRQDQTSQEAEHAPQLRSGHPSECPAEYEEDRILRTQVSSQQLPILLTPRQLPQAVIVQNKGPQLPKMITTGVESELVNIGNVANAGKVGLGKSEELYQESSHDKSVNGSERNRSSMRREASQGQGCDLNQAGTQGDKSHPKNHENDDCEDLYEDQKPLEDSRRCRVFYHATASHRVEIEWLFPVIEEVLAKAPHIEFEIVGGVKTRKLYQKLPRTTIVSPMSWLEYQKFLIEPERRKIHSIGLAPHLPTPFNAARSYTKVFDIERAGAVGILAKEGPWSQAGGNLDLSRHCLVPMQRDAWVEEVLRVSKA